MKGHEKTLWRKVLIALLFLIVVFPFSACESREEREREVKEAAEKAKKAEKPEERDVVTFDETRQAQLGIKVEPITRGRLRKVIITTGVISATFETPELLVARTQVRQAKAALERGVADATAGIESTKARLDLAAKGVERQRTLFEEKIVAKKSLELAEAEYKTAEAEFVKARKNLDSTEAILRADYEKALKTLQSLGFGSGEIAKRPSEKWLIIDVFAKDLPDIRAGQAIAISAEGSNHVFKGRIVSLPEAVDPTARAAKVRAVVEDPSDRLRLNLFARVKMETGGVGEEALLVPASAVLDEEDRKIVFIQGDSGRFKRRIVEVGEEAGGFYPILSGLSEGEKVVTHGAFQLKAALGISKVGEVD